MSLVKIKKLRDEMIDNLDSGRGRGRTEILLRDMVIRSLVKGRKPKNYLVLGHKEDFAKNYLMRHCCDIMSEFGVKFQVDIRNRCIVTPLHNIYFRGTDYREGRHFFPMKYGETFEDNSVEQMREEKRISLLGAALDV